MFYLERYCARQRQTHYIYKVHMYHILSLSFHSAHHDSRQIEPGDLFIAIKGEHVDGHSFIPAVAKAGALGALCTTPVENVPPDFLQLVVPDVVKALHANRTCKNTTSTVYNIDWHHRQQW